MNLNVGDLFFLSALKTLQVRSLNNLYVPNPPAPSCSKMSKKVAGPGSDEEEQDVLQFKLVILGDGAVGKTSLSMRFSEDIFAKSYKQTIGVDFFLKQLTLPGNKRVAVQLWDIGGQTIASKMVTNYVYGAHAILLAYDITNYQSFQDLEDWMAIVESTYTESDMPYLAILANKADLTHMRTVHPTQHIDFADSHNMHSFFVSAKTGDNVAASFCRIVADISGIVLTPPDVSNATKVVTAQVIEYSQDSSVGGSTSSDMVKVKSKCSIM